MLAPNLRGKRPTHEDMRTFSEHILMWRLAGAKVKDGTSLAQMGPQTATPGLGWWEGVGYIVETHTM